MIRKPIRLLFLSEFGSHTGFGTAGMNLVDRFYEMGRDEGMPEYDISVQALAFRRHPYDETQFPRPYKIYPMVGDQGRFPHGQDQMRDIIQMAKPKVVVCFKPDTQVMTKTGIKNITELKVGDFVLSVNPSTLQSEYRPVTALQNFNFSGELINIKAKGIDFSVTPDHKFFIRKRFSQQYEWMTAQEIYNHDKMTYKYLPPLSKMPGKIMDRYSLLSVLEKDSYKMFHVRLKETSLTNKKKLELRETGIKTSIKNPWTSSQILMIEKPEELENNSLIDMEDFRIVSKNNHHVVLGIPISFDTKDWLTFLGWYISEGSVSSEDNNIIICQREQKNNSIETSYRKEIRFLLERMKFDFFEIEGGLGISSSLLAKFLSLECGKGALNKYLPRWIFDLDSSLLKYLFDSLMKGDGNIRGNTFTTVSSKLAQDVQQLCFHLGYGATIQTERSKFKNHSLVYKVYITTFKNKLNARSFTHKFMSLEPYKGKVYCCTVEDNHTVLAGRNGTLNFAGQCFGDKWMIEHVNDPQFVPEDLRKTFYAIAYWAIDGDPIPPNWFDHFHKFDHVVFYSKFGYEQALQRDSRMQYQCSLVYHGVNPYLFRKLPSPYVGTLKERHQFKDKFVVGAVMRNQARKSHPRLLQAFQKFSQNKTDVVLLLNCLAVDQGWDLNDLINRFGLTGKVFFTHTTQNPAIGMPVEHLVGLYNMMDVHAPVAEGEGFGLPILESMSCGVPNLVNHYGAEKELVEDSGSGMTVKSDTIYMRGSDHNFMRPLVSINDLAEKLQWMYDHPEERKEMGRKGRAYAFTMNWDRFAHQFDRVIKRVMEGSQTPLQGEII